MSKNHLFLFHSCIGSGLAAVTAVIYLEIFCFRVSRASPEPDALIQVEVETAICILAQSILPHNGLITGSQVMQNPSLLRK